jgi:sarcosine/dimethylglycine N-methyltransferase
MTEGYSEVVQMARDYYNSEDADNFYYIIWGGEDLHLGIYETDNDTIFTASKRTVDRMASFASQINEKTHILDVGAGFGGTARHLAGKFGCRVTCLNLSEVENERNRKMSKEQGLDHLITVVDGSFESLSFDDGAFDIVWSQDAILHSGNRKQVITEVARVLKTGGELIFTDPMQADDCPAGVLDPILERIHLETLGSPAFYKQTAQALGMELVKFEEQTPNLIRHYSKVLEETKKNESKLEGHVSQDYIDRMKVGLQRWVDGGNKGWLAWAIFVFRK